MKHLPIQEEPEASGKKHVATGIISTEKVTHRRQLIQPQIMASFIPRKRDMSRRRSAPHDIFQTFRSHFLNTNLVPPTTSPNIMPFETVQNANLASQSHSYTLPHRRPFRMSNNNEARKNRHSLIQTKCANVERHSYEFGQDAQFLNEFNIKCNNHVPYYCNELFCKNEMEETNLKEKEEEKDQIYSKPLPVNNG